MDRMNRPTTIRRSLSPATYLLPSFAIATYVVLYSALVLPVPIDVRGIGGERYTYAHYRIGEVVSTNIFWAVNQIDHLLRPAMWDTYECTEPGSLYDVRGRFE